ncbi:g7189 [Coccomyxa elongata]
MQRLTPLHRAAQKGDLAEVESLLQKGADPGVKDGEGRTPLHHAVMRSHLAVVEALLDLGGPVLLLSKDILGCTPVHLAAVQNQVTLILKLVEALLKDEGGKTPLHEIARRRCMQDFMGFLHLGWDTATSEDVEDGNLAQLSPAWEEAAKHLDLNRPGLAAVRKIMGWSPLHLAAMDGQVALIEKLVQEFGCSITARSANSWTPLHYAAAHNQVEAIKLLVRLGCEATVQDNVASTPLHVAAGEGHLEAIAALVSLGSPPDVKDRDGCTPLYCAAAWNRAEAVRRLDALGCPSWARSEEGRTAVHVAAEQGWTDLIELLVRHFKNKVDVRDTYQFTPLHSAANGGHVKTIQKLIQFCHDVDVKDYLGRTPLHYAAMHGRLAALEVLVKAGAALNEKDVRGGYTPLHLAADAGQCEAIARLVLLGAPLETRSTKGWTPLALATLKGPTNVDAIGVMVELGAKVSAVMEHCTLETPLHIAARCGRRDVLRKLLRCGLPVLARTKDGSTPLHYAAAFGQSCVIETLVDAGCPVDATDDAQNTPLHLAAGCGFIDTVEKLVSLGADLNARDVTSCTPLQNAAHGTYSALAAVPPQNQPGVNGTAGRAGSAAASLLPAAGAVAGPRGAAAAGNGALTSAQVAAQMALCNGTSHLSNNGLTPVRTGLAWATLGSALCGPVEADTEARSGDWRGLGLMQLLKRASKRRTSTSGASGYGLDVAIARLTNAGTGSTGRGEQCIERATAESSLEALLRRTEALQLSSSMEADRARLIAVAERLVQLGAAVGARDAEGRTALHLAAGCGDKAMVLKLVALGTDINCRDSVGGTPMHHAAMANKKEMMFLLARLGCDWRARAEGIDGATAAFVLCGQHGKTTRQQKLVEAKLKRVYAEGVSERTAHAGLEGQLALEDAELAGGHDASDDGDDEASAARADANMAALLAEMDLEGCGSKAAPCAKKRRKKKKGAKAKPDEETGSVTADSEAPDAAAEAAAEDVSSLDALDASAADQPGPSTSTAQSAAGGDEAHKKPDAPSEQASTTKSERAAAGKAAKSKGAEKAGKKGEADDRSRLPTENGHHRAPEAKPMSRDEGERHAETEAGTVESQQQGEVRERLDAAIAQVLQLLDLGNAASGSQMSAAVDDLETLIGMATEVGVSAKYAKKVLKRLQRQLELAISPPQVQPSAPSAAAPPTSEAPNVPGPDKLEGQQQQQQRAPAVKLAADPAEPQKAPRNRPPAASLQPPRPKFLGQPLPPANGPAWGGPPAQAAAAAGRGPRPPPARPAAVPNGPLPVASAPPPPPPKLIKREHAWEQPPPPVLLPVPGQSPPPQRLPPPPPLPQQHSQARTPSPLWQQQQQQAGLPVGQPGSLYSQPLNMKVTPPQPAPAQFSGTRPVQAPVQPGSWGSAPGTPVSWQDAHLSAVHQGPFAATSTGAVGIQQHYSLQHGANALNPAGGVSVLAREGSQPLHGLPPPPPPGPRRSMDFGQQGPLRQGSLSRQSLDAPSPLAAAIGSLDTSSAFCSGDGTPRAAVDLGSGSSLFAHPVVPSSMGLSDGAGGRSGDSTPHSAHAASAGLAFGSKSEPGSFGLSGFGPFSNALPVPEAAGGALEGMVQQPRRDDLQPAPLQLTQSHFGPTVSANGPQGGWGQWG